MQGDEVSDVREDLKMMTGKGSGSGKYSYHKRSRGIRDVMCAHMPEDDFKVRLTFCSHGEFHAPIIKLDETDAEMLWACLNSMAKDLNWEDQ